MGGGGVTWLTIRFRSIPIIGKDGLTSSASIRSLSRVQISNGGFTKSQYTYGLFAQMTQNAQIFKSCVV